MPIDPKLSLFKSENEKLPPVTTISTAKLTKSVKAKLSKTGTVKVKKAKPAKSAKAVRSAGNPQGYTRMKDDKYEGYLDDSGLVQRDYEVTK